MFEGPDQLPTAEANSLWLNVCKEDNLPEFALCNAFEAVMILKENNRLH